MNTIKAGCWRFKDQLTFCTLPDNTTFEFHNVNFNFYEEKIATKVIYCRSFRISYDSNPKEIRYITNNSETYRVYEYAESNPGWTNQSYRTIKITENATNVPDNFYKWFMDNAIQIPSEIKGVWKFQDKLTVPRDTVGIINASIIFTNQEGAEGGFISPLQEGKEYKQFKFINKSSDGGSSVYQEINYQDATGTDVSVYNCKNNSWQDENLKVINFGEIEQKASDIRFYAWLQENATPQPAIKGIWKLKNELDLSNIPSIENVNFNCENISYIGIKCENNALIYKQNDSTEQLVYQTNIWDNDSYRIINFGENNQYVSPEFYSWLMENVLPQPTIKGAWKFNNELQLPSAFTYENVNFKCETKEYTGFIFDNENGTLNYKLNNDENLTVYSKNNWNDNSYKVINFGNVGLNITHYLDDWLIKNAVKIINIDIEANGTTILSTAGKYCNKNISIITNVDYEKAEGKTFSANQAITEDSSLLVQKSSLQDIANAIGENDLIFPGSFINAIQNPAGLIIINLEQEYNSHMNSLNTYTLATDNRLTNLSWWKVFFERVGKHYKENSTVQAQSLYGYGDSKYLTSSSFIYSCTSRGSSFSNKISNYSQFNINESGAVTYTRNGLSSSDYPFYGGIYRLIVIAQKKNTEN